MAQDIITSEEVQEDAKETGVATLDPKDLVHHAILMHKPAQIVTMGEIMETEDQIIVCSTKV